MSLLNFVRNAGKKLFGGDDEDAADKIKAYIESNNPGIKNLEVAYHEGQVSLAGKAESAEAMEKAVLLAGNVEGVVNVLSNDVEAPPQTAAIEYYEIQKGDTLSAIAKRFLGNAMDYEMIFEANREVIKDPDLIYPGQKIRIPLRKP